MRTREAVVVGGEMPSVWTSIGETEGAVPAGGREEPALQQELEVRPQGGLLAGSG